ncbi:PQQ-like beta-propeller repeat protein [soil metagenome]
MKAALVGLICLLSLGTAAPASDWPQWFGPQRDGVWREEGLVAKYPPGGPKVLWRLPVGGGYSGPAVANGRVYVMDRVRAKNEAGKPARNTRDGTPGTEAVLCLEAGTGKQIWKHEYACPYRISYASGPRCTPLIEGDRVYTIGAMGDLLCLNAADGKVVWSKNVATDYKAEVPVWGFASSPLIDNNRLICMVGGEGSAVVAFDKHTGKEIWKGLTSEEIGYSPPVIIEAGGKRQLLIWISESLNSLDPETGKAYWTQAYPEGTKVTRPAVNIMTVRKDGLRLFISSFYHGPMMLELAADKPAVKVLWHGKSNSPGKPDGIHALMATPVIKDGCIYGVCAMGELRCIDAATNKQLWQTYKATGGKKSDCGTAFIVPQGDRYVIFNDSGELILAKMSPTGYEEIDKFKILEASEAARGRMVVWSHPAFANRCVFARNDKELVCVSLAADDKKELP